jgi:putative transposase
LASRRDVCEDEVLESYLTKVRNRKTTLKSLEKAMRQHGCREGIFTDLLRSNSGALAEIDAVGRLETGGRLSDRAENSHLPFRRLERVMLRSRRKRHLRKFAAGHTSAYSLFNAERSLCTTSNFRLTRAAGPGPVVQCVHATRESIAVLGSLL